MNKKTKWGIIILVGAGIIGGGIYSQLPKKNDELAAADKVMGGNKKRGKQVLNVNAKVIKPQSLTDEFTTTGVLLPDEEVDLSFETSGKIVEINFEEGTAVKKGQLLDGNIEQLAEKISYLIENEDIRKKMGQQARMDVQRFRIENIAEQWKQLFESLIIPVNENK